MYIEEPKKINLESLNESEIRNKVNSAASNARTRAKNGLKVKLEKLKTNPELLESICWTAIHSDLLGKMAVFTGDREFTMIEDGFAHVTRKPINIKVGGGKMVQQQQQQAEEWSLKGKLTEVLALEALIEWFYEEVEHLYLEHLKRLLRSYTLSPSGLGKFAE